LTKQRLVITRAFVWRPLYSHIGSTSNGNRRFGARMLRPKVPCLVNGIGCTYRH